MLVVLLPMLPLQLQLLKLHVLLLIVPHRPLLTLRVQLIGH